MIRDTGNGFLTVRVGQFAEPFAARPAKLVIRPRGRATLQLTFHPRRAVAYSRPLRLITDDRTAAVITISVRGTGRR